MANLRAIRKRVAGVKNTKQLTRAMKMVAAAKLRRAQERVEGSRPYMKVLQNMILSISSGDSELSPIAGDGRICLVFASDRGLCGSYNSNVIKKALAVYKEQSDTQFVLFGRKVIDQFKRRGIPVARSFPEFYQGFDWDQAADTVQEVLEHCQAEQIGKLDVIYTRFVSAGVQRLQSKTLFPFTLEGGEQEATKLTDSDMWLVEPERSRVLNALVHQYARFSLFYLASEVIASEHGARMSAMDLATKNAGEMIDKLTLEMNRARQASITKELLEIISGAEALEG